MGGQISWLLPAALITLAALAWVALRRPRSGRWPGSPGRDNRAAAAALLWGGWLLVTGLVFSFMSGIIHPYYTVALAPAIGALAGIGAVLGWRSRDRLAARLVLAVALAVTGGWACLLLGRSAGWLPWLRPLVLACGLAGAVVVLAAGRLRGRTALLAVAPLALVAGLAGPVAYSIGTVATAHAGALPTAGPAVTSAGGPGGVPGRFGGGRAAGTGFPAGSGQPGAGGTGAGGTGAGAVPGGTSQRPGRSASRLPRSGAGQFPGGTAGRSGRFPGGAGGLGGGLAGRTQVSSAVTKLLTNGAAGYRWAAATVGAESAAPFQLASGEPMMAIGGFNGTDQVPSLAEFKAMVAAHEVHYFIGANGSSFGGGSGDAAQITAWVAAHFSKETVGGVTVYNLARPSS